MLTGAAVDCERILDSFWGQPVNTATSIAFVFAGLAAYLRGASRATATLIGAVGLGSIAFHGPMPPWGEFVHDLSIGWVLAWVILTESMRLRVWPFAFAGVGLLMLTPIVADPIQAVLAIGAIFLVLKSQRPQRFWMLGLLATGAVIGTLSRTGWPWCQPESIWQGHGFWHFSAAAALYLWAQVRRPLVQGFSESGGGPGQSA